MSRRTRNYVGPDDVMFRAAAYNVETGACVWTAGPYSTRGPAMAARHWWRRSGVRVVAETCWPTWVAIPGTELEASE